MSLLTDLVLLTTDPVSGRSKIQSKTADALLGGAILTELVTAGRVDLDEGMFARVRVLDPTPVNDALIQSAFERIVGRRPRRPARVVVKLGKGAKQQAYDALVAEGRLSERRKRVLGLYPVTRYDVVDVSARAGVLQRVRNVLVLGEPADARTGPLVALLGAAALLKLVVERPDLRLARKRAKAVAEGDWASAAVRRAIQAANVAVAGAAGDGGDGGG